MIRRLLRRVRTIRHFSLSQIGGRAVAGLRRWLGLTRIPAPPEDLSVGLEARTAFLHYDPWNTPSSLGEGRVTFLKESREMRRPWDWSAEHMPLLWRFHLHYFQYLHLLDERERLAVCLDWIGANPPGKGVGWHPYPTSRRIVNWCTVFGSTAPGKVKESLYRQAGYLARNLETYLSGNHVLENARALVMAGVYFGQTGEATEWLETGLRIYSEELPRQVLEDGGHYERSPMYHAQVLHGCLDVLNVLPRDRLEWRRLTEAVDEMLRFLSAMTHPDGGVSLFNDATFDGAPPVRRLAAYASEIGRSVPEEAPGDVSLSSFPETGYHRYAVPPLYFVLDAGPLGPDHQPAHGHADIFSYELSVGGDRIVTDTGVQTYEPDEMRQYCRGTHAHNTVQVDGVDQAEVWGRFRVARRFAPSVETATLEHGAFRFEGTFEGYGRLIGDGIVHRREVECDGRSRRLRVVDTVEGTGVHRVESRIHLHPDVDVTVEEEGVYLLERSGTRSRIRGSERAALELGWYCPHFGVRRRRTVVSFGLRGQLPARVEYEIQVE